MIIYKTTNLINNKFYIGKDSRNNPSYLGSGLALLNAIKKYGKENFKKEILQYCTSLEELSSAEIAWITKLDANNRKISYNIACGGQGGNLGSEVNARISRNLRKVLKERTPEQKAISQSRFRATIANRSPEARKIVFDNLSKSKKGQIPWCKGIKIPEVMRGKPRKPVSEETKELMRNKIRTPEHSKHISEAKKGKPNLKCRRKVKQLNMYTGELIKIWDSMTMASQALGATPTNIKKTIDGKCNYCKGFKWAYA
jgi:group I intron endonuclease